MTGGLFLGVWLLLGLLWAAGNYLATDWLPEGEQESTEITLIMGVLFVYKWLLWPWDIAWTVLWEDTQ